MGLVCLLVVAKDPAADLLFTTYLLHLDNLELVAAPLSHMLLTRPSISTFCSKPSLSLTRLSLPRAHTKSIRMASTDNAFAVQEAAKHATAQVEAAKRKAAFKAVEEHFKSDMQFVGIGSGSTIVYGVEAIKAHLEKYPPPPGHRNWFVPTGWNSRKVIEQFGKSGVNMP